MTGEPSATGIRSMLFPSLRGYRPRWLSADVVAGLTVWAVLVPEALAYATIAGVSPVIGLYAAPPALILYAVFGTSRHLVTGPMAATAALSAAAVADVASNDDFVAFTAILALVTGAIAMLAGILRLGFLANFISEPVLKGFIIGLALTIIVGQLPKLFGVEGADGDFFERLFGFIGDLGETHWPSLAVGVVSLLIVLGIRETVPRVPGPLVAVVVGIVATGLFDLGSRGVDIVGDIDSGLPPLGLPDGSWTDYLSLAPAAVGVMLIGFAEGLGAAKTYAARDHYQVDPNRELVGLGAANLGSGFAGGMVVNGSLSKTAVNGSAGARSQLSGLVVAALTVFTLLFLTGFFADLPEPTLAAIVIAALIELVDIRSLVALYRTYTARLGSIYGVAARPDFIAAVAALAGVLVFDTLPGLFIGIGVSLLLLVYRTSKPNVATLGRLPGSGAWVDIERHPEASPPAGVAVLRVESGLYFANAEHVRSRVRQAAATPGTTAVIIDAATIPVVDVTAAKTLAEAAEELSGSGVTLAIAREIGQVRDLLGGDATLQIYTDLDEAIAAAGHGRVPPDDGD